MEKLNPTQKVFKLIKTGQGNKVDDILNAANQPDVNFKEQDSEGLTILLNAIKYGNLNLVRGILEILKEKNISYDDQIVTIQGMRIDLLSYTRTSNPDNSEDIATSISNFKDPTSSTQQTWSAISEQIGGFIKIKNNFSKLHKSRRIKKTLKSRRSTRRG